MTVMLKGDTGELCPLLAPAMSFLIGDGKSLLILISLEVRLCVFSLSSPFRAYHWCPCLQNHGELLLQMTSLCLLWLCFLLVIRYTMNWLRQRSGLYSHGSLRQSQARAALARACIWPDLWPIFSLDAGKEET